MTDAVAVAIIGGIASSLPATLTAAVGIFISLRKGRKTDAVSVQATHAATKADEAKTTAALVADKTDELAVGQREIHTLVNSNLAAVKQDLEDAKVEIRALRDLVLGLTQGTISIAQAAKSVILKSEAD
jgi:hypothetical protein